MCKPKPAQADTRESRGNPTHLREQTSSSKDPIIQRSKGFTLLYLQERRKEGGGSVEDVTRSGRLC